MSVMIEIKEKKPITSGASSGHITNLSSLYYLDVYDDQNKRKEAYYKWC